MLLHLSFSFTWPSFLCIFAYLMKTPCGYPSWAYSNFFLKKFFFLQKQHQGKWEYFQLMKICTDKNCDVSKKSRNNKTTTGHPVLFSMTWQIYTYTYKVHCLCYAAYDAICHDFLRSVSCSASQHHQHCISIKSADQCFYTVKQFRIL